MHPLSVCVLHSSQKPVPRHGLRLEMGTRSAGLACPPSLHAERRVFFQETDMSNSHKVLGYNLEARVKYQRERKPTASEGW